VLIAGEPGVGKTRLAGEWSRQAYQLEAIVLYGRCDEDLGAPYQPFAEALRSLVPCLGTSRLRGMRGVEALLTLVPGLTEVLPDLAAPTRADPETERYALFDAVVALLEAASADAPVVLILDDLHWAAKPTLLLLRHLLRFGDRARVQIVGTYRSTDLDRSHPLAAMLADLHRGAGSGTANRLALSGLDEDDVSAYVTEAGYNDEELARALASVTGGNPFFLIEALRHVDETGGVWDPTTLPQGVRETVSRRLSRLTAETNTALAAAAVVGSRFALDLVEKVVEQDLVDAFDEACKAGIVIEEPGGRYRFNHAIVRQSLLAELPSVRRLRLHQRIASKLENEPGAGDELLAELAHHYFECAWAGNAAKAVEYCRRAADQAVARLAYEGAADLYGQALHALDEIDDELPDRDDLAGELLVARCEALLAAGDVASAADAVSKLQEATVNSPRLAAWATCFDGQLSMLIHPERLDEVETALGLAAQKLAELDDAAGEANAHTVRAACLARLGRIGHGEIALDDALTAARRARDHRRVNAVLAGAPLAALWGPNPVPRAGGRCLDVVRLLRITTDSPAVEATSTRCQAVLEAFRGRAEAARRMIESARRTVTELGLRHALLEVEQFAGIVELIADAPAAAEPHFRQAYNGFRRMGLDADTAETAALLGRTCLALDRDTEADELCLESERLAGHALKASIAWRTLRARLLSRGHEHGEARRIAEAAVALAERTDALVDHGDSCLTLATVLGASGDAAGARTAAERAVDLYERKGATALAERARRVVGQRAVPSVPPAPEVPNVEPDNTCARVIRQFDAAVFSGAVVEIEQVFAPAFSIESRRRIVGFPRRLFDTNELTALVTRLREEGAELHGRVVVATRGERWALTRVRIGTRGGAPEDELIHLVGIDEEGRIALQIWFDLEDMDAAIAELDVAYARLEDQAHRQARRLENAASHAAERHSAHFAARDWDALAKLLADDILVDDRRRPVNAGIKRGRDAEIANLRAVADVGITYTAFVVIAARGERLILTRASVGGGGSAEFSTDALSVMEVNSDNQITAIVIIELDDFDSAIAELDARYLAGEAAAHAHTWSVVTGTYASVSRQELPALTPDCVTIDHRRVTAFAPGEMTAYIRAGWEIDQTIGAYVEIVHRLSDLGAVCTYAAHAVSREGFDGDFRGVNLATVSGDMVNRSELFDEADLETALARLDQLSRPAPRLENAASQVSERYMAHFAARDWDALAKVLADDICTEDRRHIVGAGIKHGRDAEIANLRAVADVGITCFTSVVIAARGERLILAHLSGGQGGSEEFLNEVLGVAETNSHDQIVAIVLFELDDFDAAIAELDARYLAGEAAAHAHVLQPVMDAVGELNRHKPGPMLGRYAFADHRRVPFGSAENYGRAIEELWTLVPDARYWTKAVHAVDAHGLVSTLVIEGTDALGNELQWGRTFLFLSDGLRVEVYEEDDVNVALARFEELRSQARRLNNAASQAAECYLAHFAARDWDAVAKVLADDIFTDDRRRVVNAGIRHGRDAEIASLRAYADVGVRYMTSVVIATRGERLILARASGGEGGSREFRNELLVVVETNSHDQISAIVVFNLDDFDSALAELDARYLAGEAAAHANTWSVICGGHAALSRNQLPPVTSDCVSIDHRRGTSFAPGELTAYFRAGFDLDQNIRSYVEIVHRLSDVGAVCTHAAQGVSKEGFEAEWRGVDLLMVDGDMVNRCEVFREADLDAALARFDELARPAPRLENAASRVAESALGYFATRDWEAISQVLADDVVADDRRRITNAGLRRGRDAEIENWQAAANVGFTNLTATVIATRGGRLTLARLEASGRDPQAIQGEFLVVIEIDCDERFVAFVVFEFDDFDAAFAELDARYLAGEAAGHANTWSVIAGGYAALNRHELPATTPDGVSMDHRRGGAFAPGELSAYIRAAWENTPNAKIYVELVHRLSSLGAVVTQRAHGVSLEGFDAEWRDIAVMTVDGGLISRGEIFDEGDLAAALATFDQLGRPRLENTATRVQERVFSYIAAGDWDAVAQTTAENVSVDDRRRVVNAGVLHGRDANIESTQATVDVGFAMTMVGILATRGERLALIRVRVSGDDPEAIRNDALNIVEIDAEERIARNVVFDLDGFDAAFAELDARYIAGEGAAHADTWSLIAGAFVALNRYEFPPATTDVVSLDHRRGPAFAPGEGLEYIRAGWDLDQTLNIYIETAHRVNDRGAVFTWTGYGTSHEGFDAEWRGVEIMTVDGDLLSRAEVFDEADLDAALAKFDQLSLPALRLKNAVGERISVHIAARDWDALAQDFADGYCLDDRRRVVNAGVMHGREAGVENTRVAAEVGLLTNTTSTIIASRGERLTLERFQASGADHESIQNEALNIVEIDDDERIAAVVMFDVDDIDAAFEELDARYLAGEAAAHSDAWSVITHTYAAFNRHELAAADWVTIDHRPLVAIGPNDLPATIRAVWDLTPDVSVHVEAVHRLSSFGAVVTDTMSGTSPEGFDAEWRMIQLLTVEGDRIKRCEVFEEADLDAALARFDELEQRTPSFENAATRIWARAADAFNGRDVDGLLALAGAESRYEDRRKGLRDILEAPSWRKALDVVIQTAPSSWRMEVEPIAVRGARFSLTRECYRDVDDADRPIAVELLHVMELGDNDLMHDIVTFDPDDINDAFAELTARWVASGEVAYPEPLEAADRINATINRHDWNAVATHFVGAEYVNHRQPGHAVNGTIADWLSSLQTTGSLVPNLWVELAEVLARCAIGIVGRMALKGTSTDSAAIEIPFVVLILLHGERVTRLEAFEEDQRDEALARLQELNQPV
jgi:AAA ATPase domain